MAQSAVDMSASRVNRESSQPLHDQVRRIILDWIRSGIYNPGDRLPPEREIAKQLDVSLAPVRDALGILARAGHLVRRQGQGTFVATPTVKYSLRLLDGITTSLRGACDDFGTRVLAQVVSAPPTAAREALHLQRGESLINLARTFSISGRQAAFCESWLRVTPGTRAVLTHDFSDGSSLYQLLTRNGLRLAHAKAELDICLPTQALSDSTGIPFATPLLTMTIVTSDSEGSAMEWSRTMVRSELIRIQLGQQLNGVLDDG